MEGSLEAKYFHNPWTVISAVAAAVLLILAIIQTSSFLCYMPDWGCRRDCHCNRVSSQEHQEDGRSNAINM
ncbi:hypothetical protein Peur_004175 [Populus x canadensis]